MEEIIVNNENTIKTEPYNNEIVLEVKDIKKSFDMLEVLKGISFDMKKGEVLSIIGSSGGGKTTLLRCLSFLEKIDSGSITINNEEIVLSTLQNVKIKDVKSLNRRIKNRYKENRKNNKSIKEAKLESKRIVEEYKKLPKFEVKMKANYPNEEELRIKALSMGLVFQDFNLFPHMSVIDNLSLAQTCVLNKTKQEADAFSLEMLDKVGLKDRAKYYPHQLSGGQKQRVAIARALCMEPSILCFDEPTSALDPELTQEVLNVIRKLKEQGVTMLIVTHEIAFARDISDKVIFLDGGIILEQGDAKSVIDNPQTDRAKAFLSKIAK